MNVVYCIDEKFKMLAEISIKSVLKFNSHAKIYIISESQINIPNTINIIYKFSDNYKFKQYNDRLTKATYFKLYLPEILKDLDKCIYLDADTLCFKSLDNLWNTDVKFIGGCEEFFSIFIQSQKRDLQHSHYINAGMLLMNLKSLRDDNFTKKVLSNIDNIKCQYWFHDQTCLNANYHHKITILDRTYNWCVPFNINPLCLCGNNNNVHIAHFIGNEDRKCWMKKVYEWITKNHVNGEIKDVCYCMDENTHQHELCSMSIASLLKHNPNYNIHIITGDSKKEIPIPYEQHVVTKDYRRFTKMCEGIRMIKHPVGVYLKLFVPLFFDSGKVLYLDNDTLVADNLDKVFELTTEMIGGVPQTNNKSSYLSMFNRLNINGGAICFNCDKIHSSNYINDL